jgi:hypothetical protein
MKNITTLSSLSAASILFVNIGTSLAQPAWLNSSPEEMAKTFMNHEDRNGDGKVTASEFKGPEKDFTFLDTNDDGVIVLAEAPTSERLPSGMMAGEQPPKNMSNEPSKVADSSNPVSTVTLNGTTFDLYKKYDFFTWQKLPSDVKIERQPIQKFTNQDGVTHYYETVYLPSGNLNWFQAAYLAQDAGGYLVAITSKEENAFIFEQVDDERFFWKFPKYDGNPARMNHYEIKIGPFLGGFQSEGAPEPAGGWKWLSGETWSYTNWAVNLDDGVIDKDPRKNTQPNDSGNSAQGQRIMGFGEMNQPVPTWGDYMDDVGTYGVKRSPGRSYGFIIEYDSEPAAMK